MSARVPPKGYSTTMGPAGDAAVHCQTCGATGHWTYECKSSTSAKPAVKLSRTQMLRLGLQKPLKEIAPPLSEREVYDAQLKEAEKELLGGEIEAANQKKRPRDDAPPSPKKEVLIKLEADPASASLPTTVHNQPLGVKKEEDGVVVKQEEDPADDGGSTSATHSMLNRL